MAGRFLVKDIALQAGVGVATVDRVLHQRSNVRHQTVLRVQNAIEELKQQEKQINLSGRKFIIDLVIEAPQSFGKSVQEAVAAETPLLRPAVFRTRADVRSIFPEVEIERVLERIRKRGSHGVLLMAPDTPRINDAVKKLAQASIPVVAFATELTTRSRIAYVGMDNHAAGATAAYLVRKWLRNVEPQVLVSIRNNRFRGEEQREVGFRAYMRQHFDNPKIIEIVEGVGRGDNVTQQVQRALEQEPAINAVYSIGGRNRQILETLEAAGRRVEVFVAHDLDSENTKLLAQSRIDVVLDHDFRKDIQVACRALMVHHKALSRIDMPTTSELRVIVPTMLQGSV